MGKYTEFETGTQPWFDESKFDGFNFAIPMKTLVIYCVDPRASERFGRWRAPDTTSLISATICQPRRMACSRVALIWRGSVCRSWVETRA